MTTTTTTTTPTTLPKYQVKSFPLIFYWKKGILTIAIVIFATFFAYFVLKGILYAILAALIILMPVVNFIFPSHTKFYNDYAEKEQILFKKKIIYSDFDDIVMLEDGILFYKKNSGSSSAKVSFSRKSKSDYIYIFDSELKKNIFNSIINGRKSL